MTQQHNDVVALYSGGLNSTVMLYLLASKQTNLTPLSIDCLSQKRLSAASDFCERLNLDHEVLSGFSGLHREAEGASVPNEDMIMLSIGIGCALKRGLGHVAYGTHDGRAEFAAVMDAAAMLSDSNQVRVLRPFITAGKADVVALGDKLGVPMHLTWSCAKDGVRHCGKCKKCLDRQEAFKLAGVEDLTPYEKPLVLVAANGVTPLGAEISPAKKTRLYDAGRLSKVEAALDERGVIPPLS